MRFFRIILTLTAIIFLGVSCKKETALPVEMGYKYFPVNTGHWVIYDVDSVSYNDFTGEVDSFQFQIKELIESVYTDNSGRESQRLERYFRQNDTSSWTIKDVWSITLTASVAERVEENIRIVKLIFPVEAFSEWDGNSYNTLGEQIYKYQDVHSAFTINGFYLDSTLSVLQKSQYTLISEDFQQEVYAANIGLIYKKYVSLEKKPTGEITSGIDYSYTLHSYGN